MPPFDRTYVETVGPCPRTTAVAVSECWAASAKAKFRGGPVVHCENRRWLLLLTMKRLMARDRPCALFEKAVVVHG